MNETLVQVLVCILVVLVRGEQDPDYGNYDGEYGTNYEDEYPVPPPAIDDKEVDLGNEAPSEEGKEFI